MKRRLVISDIHGCSKTFKALIKKIALNKEDTLYLLGDFIDRGPDSPGTLDFIMQLQNEGFNIKPLLGNHESNFIDASLEYDSPTLKFYARRFKSANLLENGKIKKIYFDFMNKLPYYYELNDFYIVHGGIDFSKENPLARKEHLLVLRRTNYDAKKAKNKKVIVGHTPTSIDIIEHAIEKREQVIPLDNGCIYTKPHKIYDYTLLGNLLCLDLDNWHLYKMKNIDL